MLRRAPPAAHATSESGSESESSTAQRTAPHGHGPRWPLGARRRVCVWRCTGAARRAHALRERRRERLRARTRAASGFKGAQRTL
jgi:hypothetical protein